MLLQAASGARLARAAPVRGARACVARPPARARFAARAVPSGRRLEPALLPRPRVKSVRQRSAPGPRSGHVPRASSAALAASSEPAGAAPAPESAFAMLKYYAAFLVFGCAVNTIGPMLPSLAQHIGLTPLQMAPLLTAKGFGGLAGSFLCPLLPMVRRNRRACLSVASLSAARVRAGISHALRPAVHQRLVCHHSGRAEPVPDGACIFFCGSSVPSGVFDSAPAKHTAARRSRGAQVSIAAHTLIAQQHGERAGPHLNGINALFGAGSLLAPAVHRTLSPALASWSPLASYWAISCAALLVTGTHGCPCVIDKRGAECGPNAVPFLSGIRAVAASGEDHKHETAKTEATQGAYSAPAFAAWRLTTSASPPQRSP